jgi:hypothetical protein
MRSEKIAQTCSTGQIAFRKIVWGLSSLSMRRVTSITFLCSQHAPCRSPCAYSLQARLRFAVMVMQCSLPSYYNRR